MIIRITPENIDFLLQRVEDTEGLSTNFKNRCEAKNITFMAHVLTYTAVDFLLMTGVGRTSLRQIEGLLGGVKLDPPSPLPEHLRNIQDPNDLRAALTTLMRGPRLAVSGNIEWVRHLLPSEIAKNVRPEELANIFEAVQSDLEVRKNAEAVVKKYFGIDDPSA